MNLSTDRIPGGVGLLDESQTRSLELLLSTLTPEQALWLSGYLAGVAGTPPETNGTPPAGGPEITVLYGTETGNSERLARELAERASGKGIRARAVDMAEYRTRDLRKETHLVLVAATHGDGDEPEPAADFFDHLRSRKAPDLSGTKFAVLALGDSSYVSFCEAGRELDRRLEELGAERLADRADCDVDFEDEAEAWIEGLLARLQAEAPGPAGNGTGAGEGSGPGAPAGNLLAALGNGAAPAAAPKPRYSRREPYRAEIVENLLLSGRDSDKETRHLELAVEEGALPFEPGDSLGIVPRNEDAVVEAVLRALDLPAGEIVSLQGEERPLADALGEELELTKLTPGFLRDWAEAAGAAELRELAAGDDPDALRWFMACNQVVDVLELYPAAGLDAQRFVEMLRRLQPRLYSIASSARWLPDQIDLTVAVTRWTKDGKRRNGVASTYLAERREPGEAVEVYVQPNRGFRLPPDPAAPAIMIGPGTGVAPFRAFLQEREEAGADGGNWLFFGDRTFREDFLYQTEWQRFLKDGVLSRMDVAFSRDRAEKVYVQDRVRERSRDVWAWLEEGAHLYVCGDAEGMAPAVHETLVEVIREEGDRSPSEAESYLDALRRERRYQRDVY